MMVSTQHYLVLQVVCLICLLHINYGLQCKVCQKNDPECLLGQNVETRYCVNDDDVCFSWFDRKGGAVGIQRDCISYNMVEYAAMKEILGDKNNGCVKSVNGLDCFTFCSVDNCN